MAYSLWFEYEEYENPPLEDPDGFCNMAVTHADGRHEGYSICTIAYFRENIQDILDEAKQEGFVVLPDIVASSLTREHMTEVMKQVLPQSVMFEEQ